MTTLAALCTTTLFAMSIQAQTIKAALSSTSVSPGGTAQIVLTLQSPATVVNGNISFDLDPQVFAKITAINVFSASGDQVGLSDIRGLHAEVDFNSNSGGVGRLPAFPVLQITAPILPVAKKGSVGKVSVQTRSPWRDAKGTSYTVSVESPGVQIGENLSIESVSPGGSPLAPGSKVLINGNGFSPTTKLRIDDVAWTNLEFVNSNRLAFTVLGPTDLSAKLLIVSDRSEIPARYVSAFTPRYSRTIVGIPASVVPIFPNAAFSSGELGPVPVALENRTSQPVEAILSRPTLGNIKLPQPPPNTGRISIPPESIIILGEADMPQGYSDTTLSASSPLRKVQVCCPDFDKFRVSVSDAENPSVSLFRFAANPQVINWTRNSPLPAPLTVEVPSQQHPSLQLLSSTDSGVNWLDATFSDGQSRILISANPSTLALGQHQGFVTAKSTDPLALPSQLKVVLNVAAQPSIAFKPSLIKLSRKSAGNVSISCVCGPVPVSVTVPNWVTTTTSEGITPLDFSISLADRSLHIGQNGTTSGVIQVQGPGNTVSIPFEVDLNERTIDGSRIDVTISAQTGPNAPIPEYLTVYPPPTSRPVAINVSTTSGGAWLTGVLNGGFGASGLVISAVQKGLSAGTYLGTLSVVPTDGSPEPVQIIFVTFIVYDAGPGVPSKEIALNVFPRSLEFEGPAGHAQEQLLSVSTGAAPIPYEISTVVGDGPVVAASNYRPKITPMGVSIFAQAAFPGVYRGHLTITAPPGSDNKIDVPYTYTVTPWTLASAPPVIASIVNAASLRPGPIAPGEILTLFGIFGPDATTGLHLDSKGRVNQNPFGNSVLFNGIAAPITYMSPTQVNVVAPYEISSFPFVEIEFDQSGIRSPGWSIPVAAAIPGLFTQDGSGEGPATVLNADGTLNSASNPAARGSIIQVRGTGIGEMNPAGLTGEYILGSNLRTPLQPATVQIAGTEARVSTITAAPNAVAGQFQISAEVPPIFFPGIMPIVIRVGGLVSQPNTTVAIR